MHTRKDIAEAYLIESSVDIETARLTQINGLYSRTIQFSQESIEKITKACLAINDIYTRDHKTSTLFKAVFSYLQPRSYLTAYLGSIFQIFASNLYINHMFFALCP